MRGRTPDSPPLRMIDVSNVKGKDAVWIEVEIGSEFQGRAVTPIAGSKHEDGASDCTESMSWSVNGGAT